MLLRSWVRINPVVGLFIAGTLRRLWRKQFLRAIELKHYFSKYRFVYIFYWYNSFCVLYVVQFYAEQHTRRVVWITKRTLLASVLLRDEESDALHKINDYIYKIQNTYTLDVKICPQSCLMFVVEQVMKAISVHFCYEWNAGQWSYPWAVPPEHDSSSDARASVITVETELQSDRFTRELRSV